MSVAGTEKGLSQEQKELLVQMLQVRDECDKIQSESPCGRRTM